MVSENSKSIDGLLDEYEHQAQAYWDFMDQKEREEYAWMAGIIDGEGSIWAASRWNKANKTREHHIGIYVTMTHEITVKTVKGIAKVGHIYPMPPKGLISKKVGYRWICSDRQAAGVLRRCLPFLVTKRAQAVLALEIMKLKAKLGYRVTPGQMARREALVAAVHELNRGSSQDSEPTK